MGSCLTRGKRPPQVPLDRAPRLRPAHGRALAPGLRSARGASSRTPSSAGARASSSVRLRPGARASSSASALGPSFRTRLVPRPGAQGNTQSSWTSRGPNSLTESEARPRRGTVLPRALGRRRARTCVTPRVAIRGHPAGMLGRGAVRAIPALFPAGHDLPPKTPRCKSGVVFNVIKARVVPGSLVFCSRKVYCTLR